MSLDLPSMLCFRITRACNAHCGFCLAPPDGHHPDAEILGHRLDWLLDRGVRVLHFCGGEPTLHPALPRLLARAHGRGAKARLTTNAIAISDPLVDALRDACCQVKISLHGDRAHHDALVGRQAFDSTTGNLRRLLAAGVPTSVQTTVVTGGAWVVGWVADLCLAAGVRRLSVLPFIPRGKGSERREEFGLPAQERRALRELVRGTRRTLAGSLDVRWLDFTARSYHVVEADGRIVLERATETMDEVLARIPDPPGRPLTPAGRR